MPACLACGVLGNGLSPISSSTTSLPLASRARAIASTVNADSAVRFRASELSRGMNTPEFAVRPIRGRQLTDLSAMRSPAPAAGRCGE